MKLVKKAMNFGGSNNWLKNRGTESFILAFGAVFENAEERSHENIVARKCQSKALINRHIGDRKREKSKW